MSAKRALFLSLILMVQLVSFIAVSLKVALLKNILMALSGDSNIAKATLRYTTDFNAVSYIKI